MIDNTALQACPFCGNEKSPGYSLDFDKALGERICCDKTRGGCGSSTGYYRYKKDAIAAWNRRAEPAITGETSDGYHTFNELYHHRAVLFSVICNSRQSMAWKSRLHNDGTMYDGMFIVGINTPDGQATYHYDIDPYWEMFCVPELPQAPKWDGHTPAQAIERLGRLSAEPANEPLTLAELRGMLERIEEEHRQASDGHEDYTNGYRWGHRNGQMELLRRILKVGDGVCERDRRKPEGGHA